KLKKMRKSKKHVMNFLTAFVENLNTLYIMPRNHAKTQEERDKDPKAVCARYELGKNFKKVIVKAVKSLTYADYKETLFDLEYNLGDLFVFRKEVKGVPLYVKLQISTTTGDSCVKSFHEWYD
ncbi:MAG: hypothetical protein IKO56_05485, partial [Alphaproteobacteria bacterium]|nr:hypothetical protein [Alphaproteobacteria bacterium]